MAGTHGCGYFNFLLNSEKQRNLEPWVAIYEVCSTQCYIIIDFICGYAKEKGIFVFALSQFSGPDYLGAWNRLDHYRPADRSAEIFLELKNPNRHIGGSKTVDERILKLFHLT